MNKVVNDTAVGNSLEAQYVARTTGSAALAAQARELMPSGVAHDARITDPYSIYVSRAQGPRKWDVDGNCYVDYFGGHGSLLLGHNDPGIIAAVRDQLSRGTHFGACHELEVRWAQEVCGLLPSASMVRFTSSGTEATLLAVRLARAVTGKNKLVRLKGHFHGWNDHMTAGYVSHFDGSPTAGVVKGVTDNVALVDADDFDALRRVFEGGDIAGAIVEPTGAQFGRLPISDDFLHEMRRLTTQTNSLLIFDEVVTGFRVARGGYQSVVGIKPDLTTLGKILAGGLPGGAVAGTRQFFDVMDDSRSRQLGRERLNHPGTYNANPLSAAAGIAALQQVKRSDACERANSTGRMLRARLNELFEAEKVPWAAYGSFSSFHIFTNPDRLKITPTSFDPSIAKEAPLGLPRDQHLLSKIRVGLLANGIDVMARVSGWISATHGEDEVAETVKAFEMLLRGLRRDGEIP